MLDAAGNGRPTNINFEASEHTGVVENFSTSSLGSWPAGWMGCAAASSAAHRLASLLYMA